MAPPFYHLRPVKQARKLFTEILVKRKVAYYFKLFTLIENECSYDFKVI